MKIFLFLLIVLNVSCSNPSLVKNDNQHNTFSKDMSFDEFKSKLEIYALRSPYPDIKN